MDVDAVLLHVAGGLEDGPGLHRGDLGIDDAQPAAAVAEHRVELVQLLDAPRDRLGRHAELLGQLSARSGCSCSGVGRNSCSGGSSRRIVTGRPFIARNRPSKSSRWKGSSLASAFSRSSRVSARIISRISSMWSKNMCSVRHRPMPSAPKAIGLRGLVGLVGIGADLQLADACRPSSSAGRTADRSRDSSGFMRLGRSAPATTSLGLVGTLPSIDLAREAVDADPVARLAASCRRR